MSGLSERNPYVGPRPILLGEPLYGRKQEVRELFNLLQARRIVVLHSPSGAGKSSLVQAGLIPRLREGKFDVWRPIRVNFDPQGLQGVPPGTNRYLLSAMVSLEEELPAERRRTPAQLATLSFAAYLRGRPRRKGLADSSVVLVLDQFEELLTSAPLAIAEKMDFFTALGEALEAGNYWALFIVREDYLGAFSPYRDRIPTHMSNTFRLDLLGVEGAREAAEQPALAAGRAFPAVDRLVRDLSTIQVQRADGTFVAEPGLYVEPVQLQVVCRRLWEAMPDHERSIGEEDITRYADVSTALGGYYAGVVEKASRGAAAVERAIREWVGRKLIVGGIRSQVRQEPGSSAGLDNRLITQLLDSYLVRSEQRAGANWFELSHDRMVEPVLLDNQAWEAKNLHPLQVQAKLWEDSLRSAALLLGAGALRGAQAWADASPEQLTEGEWAFLDQSRTQWARDRAARRRLVALTAAAGVVAVVVGVLAVAAFAARQDAVEQRDAAQKAEKTAKAAEEQALAQEKLAVAAKNAAEVAEKAAVTARRENEKLLQGTFRAALRGLMENLAQKGSLSGEVVVDDRWTPLLERNEQRFAASTVIAGGGRILVAGHDAVLSLADRQGYSVFLEMTSQWLLGEQEQQRIVILSDAGDGKPPGPTDIERNLATLDYKHSLNPPLDQLAGAGMLILDLRHRDFTAAESAAITDFIARGGGVLAVGVGWAWRERQAARGRKLPLTDYPMNRLLSVFGASWNDRKIEGLEKPPEPKVVRVEPGPRPLPESTLEELSYFDQTRSINSSIAREVDACREANAAPAGLSTTIRIRVEGDTGRVLGATPMDDSPVGRCLARAVRFVTFPRFKRKMQEFTYRFRL